MADLNKQSLEMWNAMKPMVDREIDQQTKGAVQRRKAKVTTAPSLVTKKIGVTEPFGDQYFIPYDAKVAGAKVGDVVWVEYMYGASNAFASMFAKAVEDPRSCFATLSSAGWYRLLTLNSAGLRALTNGYRGSIITIRLLTSRGAGNRTEEHEIKLFDGSHAYPFVDEVSVSTDFLIDKIRHQYSAGEDCGFVDIHFIGTSATNVTGCFTVSVDPEAQQYFTAGTLQSVADAPSGETVLTTYEFVANTQGYTKINLPSTIASRTSVTLATIAVPKGRSAVEAIIRFRAVSPINKMLISIGNSIATLHDGDYQCIVLIAPLTTETSITVSCYVYDSSAITMQGSKNEIFYRFI